VSYITIHRVTIWHVADLITNNPLPEILLTPNQLLLTSQSVFQITLTRTEWNFSRSFVV